MKISWFNIDWTMLAALVPLLGAGLITMRPFMDGGGESFFNRQVIWAVVGLVIFFVFGRIDWSFLKTSGLLLALFLFSIIILLFLLFFGSVVRGSSSWFNLEFFSIEPADPIKLLLILILAKYFSRRHVEIAQIKHILISGFYVAVPAALVFLQPDFGSAIVFIFIWLGMVVFSGISKKHLLLVFLIACLVFAVSWFFILKPYQQNRILNFIDPMKDPQNSGYNALQSVIATGSGRIWGKGLGYGTQSRLAFLPEHRTDFVFASFAEEWGFIGVLIIFFCFGVLIYRILKNAYLGRTNFERFFGVGLSIFLMVHFALHVGMNIGLLPITGLNMPFLSYGGSNLITIFAGLGILMGMRKHSQKFSQGETVVEFL